MEDEEGTTTITEMVSADGGGQITKTTKKTVVEEMSQSRRMETSTKATKVVTSSTGETDVQTFQDSNVIHSQSSAQSAINTTNVAQDHSIGDAEIPAVTDEAEKNRETHEISSSHSLETEKQITADRTSPAVELKQENDGILPESEQLEQKEDVQKVEEVLNPPTDEQTEQEISPSFNTTNNETQLLQEESTTQKLTEEPQKEISHHKPSQGDELKENIKEQLEEIINEIDQQVNEEEQGFYHTWRPKGEYKLQKTPIQYEEVIPVKVDEVKLTEKIKPVPAKPQKKEAVKQQEEKREERSSEYKKVFYESTTTGMNGEVLTPVEIPEGIPLLAMILPKDEESENREKIPLERLFTPATDSGEITPKKGKVFANSAFYRPDHPTVDDQLELAHKISDSLVDENNKTSRGQTMYIKRKKRSDKWVHQGGHREVDEFEGYDVEEFEQQTETQTTKETTTHPKLWMPALRPVSLHESNSETSSPHVFTTNIEHREPQSPTGKGAALFAKRKRRMDKFIVDETTLKQQEKSYSAYSSSQQTVATNNFDSGFNQAQVQTTPGPELPNLDQLLTKKHRRIKPQPISAPKIDSKGDTTPKVTFSPTTPPSQSPAAFMLSPPVMKIMKTPTVGVSSISNKRSSMNEHDMKKDLGKSLMTSKWANMDPGKFVASPEISRMATIKERRRSLQLDEDIFNFNGFGGMEQMMDYLRPCSPPTVCVANREGEVSVKKSNPIPERNLISNAEDPTDKSGAMYTAEVRLVKNPSVTPQLRPVIEKPVPSACLTLTDLANRTEEDRRKSFNLAPKGWGTYQDFYTPVHLGA